MDIEFPVSSTPGEHVQQGRGRLVNMFAELIVDDRRDKRQKGQEKVVWRRVAGTKAWGWHPEGATPPWVEPAAESFRGSFFTGTKLIAVWGAKVYTYGASGGPATAQLTGTLGGSSQLIFARNLRDVTAGGPDVVAVDPTAGAFVISDTAVSPYPVVGDELPAPNSVCYLQDYFIFSNAKGMMIATEMNVTTVDPLAFDYASTRPDQLFRVLPLSGTQLIAAGDTSIEVWGPPTPPEGFPFTYVTTIAIGIIGPYAITGYEDGFSHGVFFVGRDNCVYTLNGYKPEKVSVPDLERDIKQTQDKADIHVSVFNFSGRGVVIVQTSKWSWHFDCTTLKWHQRESYLETYWRHQRPVLAFDNWIAGDRKSGKLYVIDPDIEREAGEFVVATMEGVVDAFPMKVRIARIDINYTHGVGITTGDSIVQTDPQALVSYSCDGGMTWSDPVIRRLGQMGQPRNQITVRNCGIVRGPSYKVRLAISDDVYFGILGGEVQPVAQQ